jgi:hypothetical protein
MTRRAGLRLLVIAAYWPLVRARRCVRSVNRLERFISGQGHARDASLLKLFDD